MLCSAPAYNTIFQSDTSHAVPSSIPTQQREKSRNIGTFSHSISLSGTNLVQNGEKSTCPSSDCHGSQGIDRPSRTDSTRNLPPSALPERPYSPVLGTAYNFPTQPPKKDSCPCIGYIGTLHDCCHSHL